MNDSLEETQQAIFSVAEFNIVLNQHLSLLKDVNVTGEITQMTITAKKGVYITLKDPDQNALLSVSGYAPTIQGINLVEEGMKVTISGTPELYSPMGKFSVKIFKIVPVGEGALKDAYEKLKQKLDKEGLFNPERKRELPDFITKIALITANKSAAQSDFLKILKENKANLEIDFYPVQVQGKYSEQEIISTLKFLSNKSEYDCVVLTRGGGSLEDLITFNEEQVARTIYAMNIPVVVGVGHEIDESIADFVADVRASTPSQAAYYLVAKNQAFIDRISLNADVIRQGVLARLSNAKLRVSSNYRGIERHLYDQIHNVKLMTEKLSNRINEVPQKISDSQSKLTALERLLKSFNPNNIIDRGYALIRNKEGKAIVSIAGLSEGENIDVTMRDGKISADITNLSKK
ncbi:exodeoxyribonuclease VII large subunit [Candidatus Dojkabacteria bacterium]|uniref:Exodeoxyribonuclease 7 large subunit n=1 Tax=Candidatus Dojkabacteria bacterium TaxID=2099670 RepID=A0A955L650_9BACT|nr:exodeoxyribonuclease VII large subunit [Candidatus Dojkabacteria bacterium]